MKIEYDPAHDVLNIEFLTEESIAESVELDGIIIDYGQYRGEIHHMKTRKNCGGFIYAKNY